VYKVTLLHHRQYIGQKVVRAAVGDIARHHVCGGTSAGTSSTVTDLLDDIGFRDDARHRPIRITHDNKADLPARKQLRHA
jgi:hypothetical protein